MALVSFPGRNEHKRLPKNASTTAPTAVSPSPVALPDPYRLELPAELQERLDAELCRIVRETVEACADRDDDLKACREQLEGVSQPNTNSPWPGAAQVEASISRELHTTLHAALTSACRQTPFVGYEALRPDERDDAAKTEAWLNLKAEEYGYEQGQSDAIYLALEGRFAPLYVGLEQVVERSFQVERLPGPDGSAEGGTEQLLLIESPVEDRIRYRAVDPWDYYTYPTTARGPQPSDGCLMVAERMNLTREALLWGVLYQGFDRKKVQEMIERGPASIAPDDDEAERDGISSTTGATANPRQAGTWECFSLIGRTPYLENDQGDPTIPGGLLHTDCSWMVCPALGIRFKQAYSRFDDGARPYALYHVIRKPNRQYGEGIVSIVSQLHEEMTLIERFGLNNMNLEASPMMTVTEAWLTRYSKYTVAPGRFLPRQASDPIGPKPVTWDVGSQKLVLEWLSMLDAQAQRLAATQGISTAMAGRVRKAAEVHAAEATQASKFDLFVHNLQYGTKEAMRLTKALLVRRMKERQLQEADAVTRDGTALSVTLEQLEKRYHDVPQASSDSMSPATRLARQQLVDGITMSYWTALPQFAMWQAQGYLYALKYRLLVLAGERNPEHYIGPNPESDPQAQAQAQQMVQQMLLQQQMAAQGGGQPGQPGGNGTGNTPTNFLALGDNGAGMLQASPMSPRAAGGEF